ncbi:hypothetical protein AGMMS49938_16030 [Fibrobacterales bacterium]|nr:hypothetical protein AGMMS49938_16030 [Fibrobacterales bacterium]
MTAAALAVVFAFADTSAPTDLDTLFADKEFALPKLDSTYRTAASEVPQHKSAGKEQDGVFVLQFDAIANFDAAQSRRSKLQAITGYSIQMHFDAPFYKLRGGYFTKKSSAEDKAAELSLQNISAFVIKIK